MAEFDVIVIGGGPAGSTAATAAARSGLRVLLLEAGEHPRPHVGESLLPGIIPILEDIGVLPLIEQAGFARKTGSTHWDWGKTPRWDLWFSDSDAYDAAWFVDRSRFDEVLFRHATASGVTTFEHANVREAMTDAEGRVTGVCWRNLEGIRTATAQVVIDASGPAGLIARRFSTRVAIKGLRHQAMWAHFEGTGHLPPPRSGQALFVAEDNQWFWAFPLGQGRTSVGLVQTDAQDRLGPVRRDFDAQVANSVRLQQVLGPNATRSTPVRGERDWSYRSTDVAGPGWIAVGDAAGFIDPVLSTGVMLAIHSGWHAARVATQICANEGDETGPLDAYRTTHGEIFGDLLRMVRFYYRQNVDHHAYFWESKRILLADDEPLLPRKAFMLLTSGLVGNLALEEIQSERDASVHARLDRVERTAGTLEPPHAPRDFVAVHVRVRSPDAACQHGPSLFLLVEPARSASPSLFRTQNWHINAIAPKHGNDPVSHPELGPLIRSFYRHITGSDGPTPRSFDAGWNDLRRAIGSFVATLPAEFEYVRTFGE